MFATTTGGTCPANIPNLNTGDTVTVAGSCSSTNDQCPTGFTCSSAGRCELHGSNSPLQITLSWDYAEDLDLHVQEPASNSSDGYCEIFYDNVGPRPYPDGGLVPSLNQEACPTVGWLDCDSNPSCALDYVDVENVIYAPGTTPPSGTYNVLEEFHQDCAFMFTSDEFPDAGGVPEYGMIPFAVQVKRGNQIYLYCSAVSGGSDEPADQCGSNSNCVQMASFTLP